EKNVEAEHSRQPDRADCCTSLRALRYRRRRPNDARSGKNTLTLPHSRLRVVLGRGQIERSLTMLNAAPWFSPFVILLLLPEVVPSTLDPAQDGGSAGISPADLDRQIYEVLRPVINAGADLYNRDGDRPGCYRLYQGALLTLRPLLTQH